MSGLTFTDSGSAGAAGTSSMPFDDNPSPSAEIASALGAAVRITRAAELLQLRRGVAGTGINVVVRAQSSRQRLFVAAPPDRDRVEPHPPRVLTQRWPSPPMPCTATTSPPRAGL